MVQNLRLSTVIIIHHTEYKSPREPPASARSRGAWSTLTHLTHSCLKGSSLPACTSYTSVPMVATVSDVKLPALPLALRAAGGGARQRLAVSDSGCCSGCCRGVLHRVLQWSRVQGMSLLTLKPLDKQGFPGALFGAARISESPCCSGAAYHPPHL